MTLFNTAPTTPNDREWMQIRDSLESRIKAKMREIEVRERNIRTSQHPARPQELREAREALLILQDDFKKHVALRTKYEAAGRQQLSLF